MLSKTMRLAVGNAKNKTAEWLYIKFGVDYTRPVQIYGLVNKACNARCIICDSWKEKDVTGLPAEVWINALKDMKSFSGNMHINFSGGEPLIKKDFLDILDYCSKEGISSGFTTNGLLTSKKNVDRLIKLNLFNLNISLDSMDGKIHDKVRGIPGMAEKIKQNIKYLSEQKREFNSDLRIILKPTVFNDNLDGLSDIVKYAKDLQLNGVHFQPICKWSEESSKMFQVDRQKLRAAIHALVQLKKQGYPILNSEASISQWELHFNEALQRNASSCHVPLRNLSITPDGDVSLCGFCPSSIGNIQDQLISEMWRSDKAKKLRKTLVNCKRLCMATCVVKRTWGDYIQLFLTLTKKQ